MAETSIEPERSVIGRATELSELGELLSPDASLSAVVLTGQPGIGKTTLWEATVAMARRQGDVCVLQARPSGAETRLSFAALTDLLDGIDIGGMDGIPAPQRRALGVALLREEALGDVPAGGAIRLEPRAISSAFLSVLRDMSESRPLLVAVDDVQWLDAPSNDALTFAARRLHGHPVRFLLARRPGPPSDLERALDASTLRDLGVRALSLGAVHRLLSERLGLSLSRRLLHTVFEISQGNPLFALELGRSLVEHGPPKGGAELPVPDSLNDLFGPRVTALSPPLRRILLAVALSGGLARSHLESVVDSFALEDAVADGLLIVDGERVRPSHPLLAAAARRHSGARERRELHLKLARAVTDKTLRARHLALATSQPDQDLAATLASAAATASARGTRQEAVELAEHALRLTPPGTADHTERLLELASHMSMAGELYRMGEVLMPHMESLPPGRARARGWLLLAECGDVRSLDEYVRRLDSALLECPSDAAIRAEALAKKAQASTIGRVERIGEAEAWALEALRAAATAGPDAERLALGGLGWARVFRGRSIEDLTERFGQLWDSASLADDWLSPGPPAAQRLIWRGDTAAGRATLTRLVSMADERGEVASYLMLRFQLCDLELRTGAWDTAERILDGFSAADEEVVISPNYEYSRALLAAGRGDTAEAERWAAETISRARAASVRWDEFEACRARGIAALLLGEPERAVNELQPVWEHTRREGVDDPGAFPVAPDLVEALVELGATEEARAVSDWLDRLAEDQDHPWGRATAKRCAAMIRLASSYDEGAAAALEECAAEYQELGLRFDRARCLLLLGRTQRRYKKRSAARRTLEEAASAFDDIGSPGWGERTRAELARLGTQPARSGELTPTEQRVVELAAGGLSNKEIARRLFVTVHTVEVHLAHAYAKLGVRSRSQLAARMAGGR